MNPRLPYGRPIIGTPETLNGIAREKVKIAEGRANQKGRFQALFGDPNYEETYLETIRRIDAEKLRSLARTFFRADRLTLGRYVLAIVGP